MVYSDLEKKKAYMRQYYKEYYHRKKPNTVKSQVVNNSKISIQYHRLCKSNMNFVFWLNKMINVHIELLLKTDK
jgi:hypothetical protein